MSYCELKIVEADGDVVGDMEFRNAHGFGAFVWSVLVRKYERKLYPETFGPMRRDHFKEWEDLWKAVKEERVQLRPWELMVLQFTYDRAMVRGSDIPLLVRALKRFDDAHADGIVACHLSAIGSRLLELGECRAACMYGMSVGDDLWWISAESDDEDDEGRPYNIDSDAEHWFIEPRPFGP